MTTTEAGAWAGSEQSLLLLGDPAPGSSLALFFLDGMLDEGHHARRHEATCPDRLTRPGDLGYLHDRAGRRDLYSPSGLRRLDLERLDAVPGVDHDLYAITFHGPIVLRSSDSAIKRAPAAGRSSATRLHCSPPSAEKYAAPSLVMKAARSPDE